MITANIYNDYALAWNLDGNGSSTRLVNAGVTISNPIWVKSNSGYNTYELQWGPSTTLTSPMYNYCYIYYMEYDGISRQLKKRTINVSGTTPILNPVIGNRYKLIKIYNVRELTTQEEDILYKQGIGLLGDNKEKSYYNLLNGCNGIIQSDGNGNLVNLTNGNKLNKISGTSCIDIVGNNYGIRDPNFTHSTTFTNSYCYKYGVFTKNDSGITTTTINGLGDYSTIYLFNRTLTTDEEHSLEVNSKSTYLNRYRTWNNNYYGIINSNGYDIKNNIQGTKVGTIDSNKYGKLNTIKFGGNSYINMGDNYDIGLSNFSRGVRVKCLPATGTHGIFNKSYQNSALGRWGFVYNSTQLYSVLDVNAGATGSIIIQPSNITDNNWHRLVSTVNRNGLHRFYIDGRYVNAVNISAYSANNMNTIANCVIGCYPGAVPTSYTNYLNGEVALPFVEYRELTEKEVINDYHSNKGNFTI